MIISKSLLNKFLTIIVLPLAVVFAVTACSDDDPVGADDPEDISPGLNVVETAEQLGNHSVLADLVEEAGLTEALAAEEDITLLAPTNSAFDNLPDGLLESLTPEQVESILMYHVIDGIAGSPEVGERLETKSLNDEWMLLEVSGENININNTVTSEFADVGASNGVVHVIDEILLPSDMRVELDQANIIDVANNAEGFDILLDAIEELQLTPTLKFEGPFTVFPPNDEAFAEFGISNVESLSAEELTEVLSYHILPVALESEVIEDRSQFMAITNEDLFFTMENGGVVVNNSASVILGDVEATNGLIHAIDNVLLPDAFGTIATNINKRFMLSELNELIGEYDLDGLFNDPNSQFTIFAPSDEAVQNAESELMLMTDQERTETLLYHAVEAPITSDALGESQTVETANDGEELLVEVVEGIVIINEDAIVENPDNISSNGVIHIIDSMLIPEGILDVATD